MNTKSLLDVKNFNEAMELCGKIAEFDAEGMQTIICMSIDMCSAKYGEDSVEIANRILELIKAVNADCGKFQIF